MNQFQSVNGNFIIITEMTVDGAGVNDVILILK